MPQSCLDARHPAVVGLVIVAEQVQQPVQRQHPQLGATGVPRLVGLARGDARRDDDIAQIRRIGGSRCLRSRRPAASRARRHRKRQDIGRVVLAAERPIQRAHPAVADERDRDFAAARSGAAFSSQARRPRAADGVAVRSRDGDDHPRAPGGLRGVAFACHMTV